MVSREQEGFDWQRLTLPEYLDALFEDRPHDQFTVVAHGDDVPSIRRLLDERGRHIEVQEGNRPKGQPMLRGVGRPEQPEDLPRLEAEDLARAWRKYHRSNEVTHDSMTAAFERMIGDGILIPAVRHV